MDIQKQKKGVSRNPVLQPLQEAYTPYCLSLEKRIVFDAAGAATVADAVNSADAAVAVTDALQQTPAAASEEAVATPSSADAESRYMLDGTAANTHEGVQSVLFVDTGVKDYQSLLNDVAAGTDIIYLDSTTDGVKQIADALAGYSNLKSIQILSHGDTGQITLGNSTLTNDTLESYNAELQRWGNALRETGDILIFGCNIAGGADGNSFVNNLAGKTGADIAASIDDTGNVSLGGNWVLELQTGSIESSSVLSAQAEASYQGILAQTTETFNVDPGFSGSGVHSTCTTCVTSFTIGGFTFANTGAGDGGGVDFLWRNNWGVTGDGAINPASAGTYVAGSALESFTIKKVGGGSFDFISLDFFIANTEVITMKGSLNGTTVGTVSKTGTQAYTTFAFSGGATTVDTITFSTDYFDGSWDSFDNLITAPASVTNTAPAIGGVSSGQAVNDNATISPFSSTTITDADGNNVTVTVTLDTQAKGIFTSASLTASGFTDNGNGSYSLASTTTSAAQTAIRALVFDPTNNRVSPGNTETTTFTIDVNDGTVTTSNNTTTVVSTSINDVPTVGGVSSGQAVNDNATLSPFSSVTIADADGQNVTVTVTLDTQAKGSFTSASLTSSGFTDNGNGSYSLASTSASAAQAAVRALVFSPTSNRVTPSSTETTTFTIAVSDGAATTSNNTTTVVSTSINDAPTVGGVTAGQTTNENVNISPFSSVTIADADGQNVTVTVTLDTQAKGSFTSASLTASGFTDNGNGSYSLASTSASAAQAAVRALVFSPTLNRVALNSTETTTFTIAVSDGTATTTDNTTTVVSKNVNDSPTIGGAGAGQTVNDTATISPFSGITLADADSANLSVTITLDTQAKGSFTSASLTASGFTDNGNGSYSLASTSASAAQAAVRALVFSPTSNRVTPGSTETTTFTIAVSDGITTTTDSTTTVVSTSVNDAPTVGGVSSGQAVNDNATLSPFSSVTIADADGQNVTVTITLDTQAKGSFTSASLTASGFTDNGNGSYSLASTSASAAQAAVRALVFSPTSGRVTPGSTETTTFTISVSDGTTTTTDSTTTVVSTAVNTAPAIGGISSSLAVNDNATVSPFSSVTIADADGQNVTVTITLDTQAKGSFTSASLIASGFTDNGNGSYSLASTSASAAQAAVRALVFDPANNRVTPGSTETTTFTISVSDGTTTTTDSTTTVVSTSINDAPVISSSGGALSYVEDNGQNVMGSGYALAVDSSLTLSDADSTNLTGATVTISKGYLSGEDKLLFTAVKGITGTWDAATGRLTLTGTASVADYQNALRSVQYQNSSDAPDTVNRMVTFTVQDAHGGESSTTRDITVTPTADFPQYKGGTQASEKVTGFSHITRNYLQDFSDPDGGVLKISGFDYKGNGTLTYNGDGTFTYVGLVNYNGPDSFSYTVSNAAGLSVTRTVSLDVRTPIQPPPPPPSLDSGSTVPTDTGGQDNPVITNTDTTSVVTIDNLLSQVVDTGGGDNTTPSVEDNTNTDTALSEVIVEPVSDVVVQPVVTGSDSSSTPVESSSGSESNNTSTPVISTGFSGESNSAPVQNEITLPPVQAEVHVAESGVRTFIFESVIKLDVIKTTQESADTAVADIAKVEIIAEASNGTVTSDGQGGFTYIPRAGFEGSDTFSYQVSDGNGNVTIATVTINTKDGSVDIKQKEGSKNIAVPDAVKGEKNMPAGKNTGEEGISTDNSPGKGLQSGLHHTLNAEGLFAELTGTQQDVHERIAEMDALFDNGIDSLLEMLLSSEESLSVAEDVKVVS